MAGSMEDLIVRIRGDASQLQSALRQSRTAIQQAATEFERAGSRIEGIKQKLASTGQALQNAGQKMQGIGRSMAIGVTVPLAAVGRLATKEFMAFELSLSRIEGLVGISKDEVKKLGDEALSMAGRVAIGPNELAEALYFITSSGFKGAAALDILEMSAKGATAGLGETKVVADLVTSAVTAYGPANLSAAQATDILVATVREGKAEAPALVAALGQVLPIASEMGVSFDQVGAAIASMTLTGTTAETAVIQLRQVFATILDPTEEAKETLEQFGFTAQGLRDSLKLEGLHPTLLKLKSTFGSNEVAISKVFGNIRALTSALSLTGKHAKENEEIFQRLTNTTGDLDKAFKAASETSWFRWNQAIAEVKVELIRLEDIMKPVINFFADKIMEATLAWRELSPEVKRVVVVVAAIAAAIGPVLILLGTLTVFAGFAFTGLAAIAGVIGVFGRLALGVVAVLNPLKLLAGWLALVRGIALLIVVPPWMYIIAAGVLIERSWSDITSTVGAAWQSIMNFAKDTFTFLKLIVQNFGEIAEGVLEMLRGAWESLKEAAKPFVDILDTLIEKGGEFLEGFAGSAAASAIITVIAIVKGLGAAFTLAGEAASSAFGWLGGMFGGTSSEAAGLSMTVAELGRIIGALTGAVVGAYIAYRTLSVVVGVLWMFINMLHLPIIVQTALWVAWKVVVLAVSAAVAVAKIMMTALTGVLGLLQLALLAIVAIVALPAFVALAGIFGAVVSTARSLVSVLQSVPETIAPLRVVGDVFSEWGDILSNVLRAARVDMDLAWEVLKTGGALAIAQFKALWPPLWAFIKAGFAALLDMVRDLFDAELTLIAFKIKTNLAIAGTGGIGAEKGKKNIAEMEKATAGLQKQIKQLAGAKIEEAVGDFKPDMDTEEIRAARKAQQEAVAKIPLAEQKDLEKKVKEKKVAEDARADEIRRLQKELEGLDKTQDEVVKGAAKMAEAFNAVGRFGVEAFDRITEHIAMMNRAPKEVAQAGLGHGALDVVKEQRREEIRKRLKELGSNPDVKSGVIQLPFVQDVFDRLWKAAGAGVVPVVPPGGPVPPAGPGPGGPPMERPPPAGGGADPEIRGYLKRIADAVEAQNRKAGIKVEGAGLG